MLQREITLEEGPVGAGGTPIGGLTALTVTLPAGNWYRLTCTFTNIKATVANSYSVTATFQDMGADGATPGLTNLVLPPFAGSLATTNVVNADIVNDSSVFAAFRGFDNASLDEGIGIRQSL